MKETKSSSGESFEASKASSKGSKSKFARQSKSNESLNGEEGEVLFTLPTGFKYRLPGKRQRMAVGLIVVGLNILLVMAVLAYFYIPGFQEFIYTVGR